MGAATSQQRIMSAHTQLLEDLVGVKRWGYGDPYWQELLSFPVPLTKLSPHELEATALPYCEALAKNNTATHNFQTLLEHLLQKLQELNTPESAQQATNAVVFVRILIKYLTESLNSDDLVAFLDAPMRAARAGPAKASESEASWVEGLVDATVHVLTSASLREATYLLHLETMHLLLVMVSTQLYSPSASAEPGGHPFTEVLMDSPGTAQALLLTLLEHYIERRPLPAKAPVFVPLQTEKRGVLRMVRSAAASMFWLPIQALTFLVRSGNQQLPESPLCETGLLLLLVLLHHAPATGHANPFQGALQTLQDTGSHDTDDEEEAPGFSGRSAEGLSYSALYAALGRNLTNERSVLLLYDLLHTCPHFRNFVVVQSDLDVLLLPLLQMLYSATGRTASQMYMLLIVILILSQDPVFSEMIHKVSLSNVPWYNERLLKDTSLGSLLVVLLLRTAHYNLSKLKDVYLHTNTLAALANLAPHMSSLSSHAAQRLVSLFDMLTRRYMRLSKWAEEGKPQEANTTQELQVYYDFLRIVLEIINCIIVRGLHRNPELVYALLHRQDVFTPFQEYAQFRDLLENLQLVIRFFNERIDAAKADGRFEWSVSKVLEVVRANLEKWPGQHSLRHFPELRFTYEEEASPEGFFVPYVWTLAVTHTAIPWRPQAIALFLPVTGGDEDAATLDGVTADQELAQLASHEGHLSNASDNV